MDKSKRWILHLREYGTSVLVAVGDSGIPAVMYWGADLGATTDADLEAAALGSERMDVDNVPDVPLNAGILPAVWTGWTGRPGLVGHRNNGTDWSPRLRVEKILVASGDAEAADVPVGVHSDLTGQLTFLMRDDHAKLAVTIELMIGPGGAVRTRAAVSNLAEADYHVGGLDLVLPLPLEDTEVLDFSGHWAKERCPQRSVLGVGEHLRDNRRGRPGFDSPTVLFVGPVGFNFRHGLVRGVHVGSGGNSRYYAERLPEGLQVLGGGRALNPGEIILGAAGSDTDSYLGPWLTFCYGEGLDAAANQLHTWARSRPSAPRRERPVTLNVWEAVHFDHSLPRLLELAELAAQVGVERYVLDDGWFKHRRGDFAGLGDWQVDPDVWPTGLEPLVERVRELGMEFGLWFEPEMVNPDSDLARAHPDWILAAGPTWPLPWRKQQVLDLTIPQAYEYILESMSELIGRLGIAYIKWDHNRDTFDAGTSAAGGRSVATDQVNAALRIMAELRHRHPELEIESCSSGGARIDLEMVEHTQRFWASDCIDAHERQEIVRWTLQLVPPEVIGTHIGSARDHSTARCLDLSTRAATALWGHMGVEWDLTRVDPADIDALKDWIALHKQFRALLHSGTTVRDEIGDGAMWLHGVVAPDGQRALYQLFSHHHGHFVIQGRLRLPGLDPARRYRVKPLMIHGGPDGMYAPPPWFGQDHSGVVATGALLGEMGLTCPDFYPEQVLLLQVDAE